MVSAKQSLVLVLSVILLFASAPADNGLAMEPLNNGIPDSAETIRPLLISAKAPILVLKSSDGNEFDLNAAIDEKPVVLIFYRGGWSLYCTEQLGRLQEYENRFNELGYQIIAISPDRPENVQRLINTYDYSFTLLSDSNKAAAKAFGIAFRLSDTLNKEYKGKGIYIENASGATDHVLPAPSVFIITQDNIIRFEYVNPDYSVRIDPDILLSVAKAIKENKM